MLTPELRERLLELSTALLVDARLRLGLTEHHLDPGIRPVVPFSRMAGVAVTVRLEVASNEASADLSLYAQTLASGNGAAAKIVVVQIPQPLHAYGIFGEGAATTARINGFTGALIEGAARDSHELKDMGFPAFSRTLAPGYIVRKAKAVCAGEPVVVGGTTIYPDDAILGDNDGVVVIRPDELDAVIDRAEAIKRWENEIHGHLAKGLTGAQAIEIVGPVP